METFPDAQSIQVVIASFILALITFIIALRAGFFRLPSHPAVLGIKLIHVLFIFGIYVLMAFVVFPAVLFLFARPYVLAVGEFPENLMKWGQVTALIVIFFCLIGYTLTIGKETRRSIFWGEEKPTIQRFFKTFFMGVLAWIVSYPIVLFVNSLTGLISLFIWGKSGTEQVAVSQLKKTIDDPLLFSAMLVVVAFIVPFMEELMFRGFLQTYLKKYLGTFFAIFTTAAIFSSVHFATSQGVGNFQLILSLFILALFLGFIYEKEQSLWASFGLHASFNFSSALIIYFQS